MLWLQVEESKRDGLNVCPNAVLAFNSTSLEEKHSWRCSDDDDNNIDGTDDDDNADDNDNDENDDDRIGIGGRFYATVN